MADVRETIPPEGVVKRCECHGMFWRPYLWLGSTVRDTVTARGYKYRDRFSDEDYVTTFTFTREEWEALQRA